MTDESVSVPFAWLAELKNQHLYECWQMPEGRDGLDGDDREELRAGCPA
jgi:hypothetical protein